MSYINTTGKTRVIVNGIDVSNYVLEGTLTDDSAYDNHIIKSSGQIVLGGKTSDFTVLDINQSQFKIGSKVKIYCVYDNGNSALHPRGTLFVLNSSVNLEEATLTLEVGCSLTFIDNNEEAYSPAVESLYTDLLSETERCLFIDQEKTLSNLAAILETLGYAIYQDCYGYVQKVDLFGSDGFGTAVPGKLTSFDKYTAVAIESISNTAIEENVKAVKTELNINVDSGKGTGSDYEPLIKSETTRLIGRPRLRSTHIVSGTILGGNINFYFDEVAEKESSELLSSPDCGTTTTPKDKNDGVKSSVKAFGGAYTSEEDYREKVVSGSASLYEGPGNQISIEEDWEWSSVFTYANSYWSGILDAISQAISNEMQEAQALIGKANSAIDKRNSVNQFTNGNYSKSWLYYNCQVEYYLSAAESRCFNAKKMIDYANNEFNRKSSIYNLSRYQVTAYKYNDDGSLKQKITKNYVNTFAVNAVVASVRDIFASFSYNLDSEGLIEGKKFIGMDFGPVNAVLSGVPYTVNNLDGTTVYKGYGTLPSDLDLKGDSRSVFSSKPIPSEALFTSPTQNDGVRDVDMFAQLVLVAKTVESYTYNPTGFDIRLEEFYDYQDSSNNYSRKNFSSSGSTRPSIADKMPSDSNDTKSLCGTVFCNVDTITKTVEVKVDVIPDADYQNQGWFGEAVPYEKSVNIPAEFAPLLPIKSGESCLPNTDYATKMAKYEEIARKYCSLVAKKISGDNRGFRISEKMRAELAEYYPFYPISISLESIKKGFTARSSAATWGFDSENSICSIDFFLTSEVTVAKYPSPTTRVFYAKTETTKTLTPDDLKIGATTAYIKIETLPTTGNLRVSGTPVAVGDEITVATINAGNLVFVPSGINTVSINFTFEQYDSNDVLLSSIIRTYPKYNFYLPDPDNVVADGGDFTAGTSQDRVSADAGDLIDDISDGGLPLDAGDLTTLATVIFEEYLLPSDAPSVTGEADPETDYGIVVLDDEDFEITTSSLSSVAGAIGAILPVSLNVSILPTLRVELEAVIEAFEGWDFGFIDTVYGYTIDLGSIDDPNAYNLDFGSIDTPIEPVIESSVV